MPIIFNIYLKLKPFLKNYNSNRMTYFHIIKLIHYNDKKIPEMRIDFKCYSFGKIVK